MTHHTNLRDEQACESSHNFLHNEQALRNDSFCVAQQERGAPFLPTTNFVVNSDFVHWSLEGFDKEMDLKTGHSPQHHHTEFHRPWSHYSLERTDTAGVVRLARRIRPVLVNDRDAMRTRTTRTTPHNDQVASDDVYMCIGGGNGHKNEAFTTLQRFEAEFLRKVLRTKRRRRRRLQVSAQHHHQRLKSPLLSPSTQQTTSESGGSQTMNLASAAQPTPVHLPSKPSSATHQNPPTELDAKAASAPIFFCEATQLALHLVPVRPPHLYVLPLGCLLSFLAHMAIRHKHPFSAKTMRRNYCIGMSGG